MTTIWRPRITIPWQRDRGVEDRNSNMVEIERAINGIPLQLDGDNILYVMLPQTNSASSSIVNIGPLAAWTAWTPTVTAAAGTITTVGAVSGTYMRVGRTIIWQAILNITTNGTGSAAIRTTAPATAKAATLFAGSGTEHGVANKSLNCMFVTTTSIQILFYDGTYPGANSAQMVVGGVYEAAA